MTRRRWTVVGAVLVALVVVAAGVLVATRLLGDDAGERARAVDATFPEAALLAPDDAQRVLWTDWAAVRDAVDLDLDASSTPEQVEDLVSRGFDADLTPASALGESAAVMQERFGFSPATLAWELFVQSETAAFLTMRLDGVPTADVEDALRALRYDEPDDPDGTWTSSTDLPISGSVTPELSYVSLDAESGLVFASDRVDGVDVARKAAAAASGHPVPAAVVDSLGDPVTALAYDATYACSALAMANADTSEQAEGEQLVRQAGTVNPLTGFAIGGGTDGDVRVALGFEDDDQARTNADTRAALLAGPAPGQGGDFADRFDVERVAAEGDVVRIDLTAHEGDYVVSDLSSGPVLFATC